jgi:hypothetical protein
MNGYEKRIEALEALLNVRRTLVVPVTTHAQAWNAGPLARHAHPNAQVIVVVTGVPASE